MGTTTKAMFSKICAVAALCTAVATATPVNPTCTGVLMLGVYKRNGATGVTNRAVEDKIGAPSKLTWGSVAKSSFGCTDGRWQMNSMYTPGSDIGEFILAVSTFEKMTGETMSSNQIETLLTQYLEKTNKAVFGMCATKSTTDAMEKVVRSNANVSADAAMPTMTPEMAKASGQELATEANMGDSFLKKLMSSPEEYKCRPDVAKKVVSAFYAIMFKCGVASQKTHVYSLVGESAPVGFVNVKAGKRCNNLGVAPLLKAAASEEGLQMLINSEDAVALFRADLANYFQESTSKVDAMDMATEMAKTGEVQLKKFVATFGELPAFSAEIK